MLQRRMDLTDKQWEVLGPLLPPIVFAMMGRADPGRIRETSSTPFFGSFEQARRGRTCLSAAPSHQTSSPISTVGAGGCRRVQEGTLDRLLRALAQRLTRTRRHNLSETFIDGSFVSVLTS